MRAAPAVRPNTTPPDVATPAIEVRGLTRRYDDVTALADVSFTVAEHTVCGLLGRNGAGKTTLMQILTGQNWQSTGDVRVFGAAPFENEPLLRQVCFIKESQRYTDISVQAVLRAAGRLFAGWDQELADRLIHDFALPRRRPLKKLSRGMQSAVGITVGLASRARLTLFDEPYLGLDAVARQLFYDHLLADIAEHPRTVLLSTHLIDEVSDLIQDVVVLDGGRVLLAGAAEDLRGRALTVTGPAAAAAEFARPHQVLHREELGGTARLTVTGELGPADRALAARLGLQTEPLSLQQLVVRTTTAGRPADRSTGKENAR